MRRAAALLTLAVALLPACAFNHIDLVQDHRVHITAPAEQQHVRLPVTISWRTDGLASNRFAVFVDRRVIKPGAALTGDATYLREHGVYVVDADSLTIPFLPDRRLTGINRDFHTVTVVILDGDHRSGESAFTRDFVIDR
jgi:hypothetical protein